MFVSLRREHARVQVLEHFILSSIFLDSFWKRKKIQCSTGVFTQAKMKFQIVVLERVTNDFFSSKFAFCQSAYLKHSQEAFCLAGSCCFRVL